MEQRGIFLSYFAINISQLPLSSLFLGLYRSTDVSQKVPTDNTKFCMNLSPISAGKFKLRFSWRTRMYLMSCNRFKTQPCNLSFPTKGCQAPSPLSSYDRFKICWRPAPACHQVPGGPLLLPAPIVLLLSHLNTLHTLTTGTHLLILFLAKIQLWYKTVWSPTRIIPTLSIRQLKNRFPLKQQRPDSRRRRIQYNRDETNSLSPT